MLVVGILLEDVKDFCNFCVFFGCLVVVVYNLLVSVMLFGDVDVIIFVKKVFDEEKKFVCFFKVDIVYYFYYMLFCGDLYIVFF